MNSHHYSFQDLENFLNRIPEKTILKGSSKARLKMMAFSVIGVILTIAAFISSQKGASSLNLVIILAIISIFFMVFTKVKWNDGNINILEFNHQNIQIKDINQPIPLDSISEYSYRHDDHDTLTLVIENPIHGLTLTSKFRGGIGASVVITQNSNQQMIRITVPYSFTLNGKNLTPDECSNIVESYLSIPEIKRKMITAT